MQNSGVSISNEKTRPPTSSRSTERSAASPPSSSAAERLGASHSCEKVGPKSCACSGRYLSGGASDAHSPVPHEPLLGGGGSVVSGHSLRLMETWDRIDEGA